MDGVDDVPLAKKYGERSQMIIRVASHGVTDWHRDWSEWSITRTRACWDWRLVLSVHYPARRKFDFHCSHLHTQLLEFSYRTLLLIMLPGYHLADGPYHVSGILSRNCRVSNTREIWFLVIWLWSIYYNCLLEPHCYQLGLSWVMVWLPICQTSRILVALLSAVV